MKKRFRSIFIFVILLILIGVIFIEIYLHLDLLNDQIKTIIEKFGYLGIFIFCILTDSLEQPIGPEVPASLGILVGFNFLGVLIFSVLGSWVGSWISYSIGWRYFYYRLKEVSEEKIKRKHYKLFEKYGGFALLLAAISPIPWTAFCWLAGGFRLKKRQFIFWGLVPRLIRIGFVIGVVWYAQVLI